MTENFEKPRTETVLLVDDDQRVRTVLQRFLSSRGFTVLTAIDGAHALHVADMHTAPIDLVVSDVVMPDMGGPELFHQLRAWRPSIPFLFISGQIEGAGADLSTDGRTAFLPKPFSFEELMEFVQQVLESDSPLVLATAS